MSTPTPHNAEQEAPLQVLDEPCFAPLTCDYEKYLPMLKGHPMSDDEKREVLEALWKISVGFVDDQFAVTHLNNRSQTLDADSVSVLPSMEYFENNNAEAARRSTKRIAGEWIHESA